jgi:hypothetical protein
MVVWLWSALRARILIETSMQMRLLTSRGSAYTHPVICTHPLLFVSWKSTLIIALDACFKLKLKDRSFVDPDLGTRLAYMVDDHKYQLHLSRCPKDAPDEVC